MIKFLMKTFQNEPSENNFENWEVFNHDIYLNGSESKKKRNKTRYMSRKI